jgi:DNA-binding response OmpR family regulator
MGMLNRLRERSSELRRQWDHFNSESRTILAATNNLSLRMSLRVLSLEQGWRVLFADSLEDGLRLQSLNKISILVYDGDVAGVDWRRGLRTFLDSPGAFFPIVISAVPNSRLRSEVLRCGGYDVARNPLDPRDFAALVNGALALARSIDAA